MHLIIITCVSVGAGNKVLVDRGTHRTHNFILHPGAVARHSAVRIVFAVLRASAKEYRFNPDIISSAALLSDS